MKNLFIGVDFSKEKVDVAIIFALVSVPCMLTHGNILYKFHIFSKLNVDDHKSCNECTLW